MMHHVNMQHAGCQRPMMDEDVQYMLSGFHAACEAMVLLHVNVQLLKQHSVPMGKCGRAALIWLRDATSLRDVEL